MEQARVPPALGAGTVRQISMQPATRPLTNDARVCRDRFDGDDHHSRVSVRMDGGTYIGGIAIGIGETSDTDGLWLREGWCTVRCILRVYVCRSGSLFLCVKVRWRVRHGGLESVVNNEGIVSTRQVKLQNMYVIYIRP
jgi:hypothetical protein